MTIYNPIAHVRCVLGDGHEFTPVHDSNAVPSLSTDCDQCGRRGVSPLLFSLKLLAFFTVIGPLFALHQWYRRRFGEEVSEA